MNILRTISKRERLVWIIVTVSLAGFILLVTLAPNLAAQAQGGNDQEALQRFDSVYFYVKDNFVDADKTDAKRLIDGALDGLFKSLDDSHSVYFKNSQERQELEDTTSGSFGGIGCYISKQQVYDMDGKPVENTPIEIVSPFEGTPAYRAGVNAGDLIMKIDGESTLDLTTDDAVSRLRGKPGTSVTLTIRRGGSLEFDVVIVRGTIEIPTVKSALINGNIGYIRLIEFSAYAPARMKDALLDVQSKGAKSIVLDLRANPGGLLDSAISIADYFIPEGTIVSVLGRSPSQNAVYFAKKGNDLVPADMPVTVLINKSSASASEILAGALKDNGRAEIVGETSYGKGSVQVPFSRDDLTFKLTVARYYSPSGATVDKVGITPTVEVKVPALSDDELKAYEKIIKGGLIAGWVKHHHSPTDRQIRAFIAELQKKGIELRETSLRRLILDEIYRTVNNPPVYDLGSDIVLKKAVDLLNAKKK
ncbi:MAG: S41 family peptidase [Spirochaetales bacterium]|nr:S41 family peptidase [Spirochaetales bacterium]